MGSVKDLEIIKSPEEGETGIGIFTFSDRYSVFDWGEMPDRLENKGNVLCLVGGYFLEEAEKLGIQTHFMGFLCKDKTVSFDQLEEPVNRMQVRLVRVIKPKFREGRYCYGYRPGMANFLIPLEIIYRNGLPAGSSIFKRLERGQVKPEDLGLDHYPKEGERLERPIIEVSTKLEESDRYISWEEAKELVKLTDREVEQIKQITLGANGLVSERVKDAGLYNEDGKLEFAFDPDRNLMLVDVFGTPDECRFSYQGIPVSKEIARQHYKRTPWYQDVTRAKELAEKRGVKDWRLFCRSEPKGLPGDLKEIIEEVYMAFANAVLPKKFFDARPLDRVLEDYKEWWSRFNSNY
ncbi:MAG: phosphoribosylaminoimidazolesuccinocarboxamide synthase [Candidatus Aenigmatarchaeota archaeon]|nr:MAG: phosphoribosylaminoimidazolesuccinocarboxamide synthase [Candidatus Aenigmarchaeota archaeon]